MSNRRPYGLPPRKAKAGLGLASALILLPWAALQGARPADWQLALQGAFVVLAATGVRLTITLAREMQRAGVRYGISSACVGGGQGMALLLENPATEIDELIAKIADRMPQVTVGDGTAAEDEVEVRSGGPLGQVCAVGGAQRQEADAVGGVVDPVDDEKRLRLGLSRFRNHACLLHWAQRAVSPPLRARAPGCICTQGGEAGRDVVRVRTSCQSTHVRDGCVTQETFHRRKVFRGRTIWPSVGARRPIAPA